MVLAQGLMGLQDPAAHSHGSGKEASALSYSLCGLFHGAAFDLPSSAQVMEREQQPCAKETHAYKNIQTIKVRKAKVLAPVPMTADQLACVVFSLI